MKFVAVVHISDPEIVEGRPHHIEVCHFEIPDDQLRNERGRRVLSALGDIYSEDMRKCSVTFSRIREVKE